MSTKCRFPRPSRRGTLRIQAALVQRKVLNLYRVEKAGQKLDVWVSNEARPVWLVRMQSAGKQKEENYDLELQELLSGVAPKIDPAKAGPLSEEMKRLLTKR